MKLRSQTEHSPIFDETIELGIADGLTWQEIASKLYHSSTTLSAGEAARLCMDYQQWLPTSHPYGTQGESYWGIMNFWAEIAYNI